MNSEPFVLTGKPGTVSGHPVLPQPCGVCAGAVMLKDEVSIQGSFL